MPISVLKNYFLSIKIIARFGFVILNASNFNKLAYFLDLKTKKARKYYYFVY